MDRQKQYAAIDLKSFYASVECVERTLDPLTTNLVVADESRTEKTICLAVSPSLKALGIPGRPRLFEVIEMVKKINASRKLRAPGGEFTGSSWDARELQANPGLKLDYIVAPPQMQRYMDASAGIYSVYLKYVAPEDIHVYSIDEVFMDLTPYLGTYGCTARELTMRMIRDVLSRTGVTATAGIGTNLYLCKIAMDIVAKKMPPDRDGVRIAQLDEKSYRRQLWDHRPLTDFWRLGPGIARKLEQNGMHTMGDVARCSVGKASDRLNEELLYRLFGVGAELLIDHAWGWENCEIADIKAYVPESNSVSSGQVLFRPYRFEEARLIVREMTDLLVLDLVEKGLVTDQIALSVGYDAESLKDPTVAAAYLGKTDSRWYGKAVPKGAHGSVNLPRHTSSTKQILRSAVELYDRITDPTLLVRRICVAANHVLPEGNVPPDDAQLSFFNDPAQQIRRDRARDKERRQQKAILSIQQKYGKNAIVKAMNLEQAGTTLQRNEQVGGHRKG